MSDQLDKIIDARGQLDAQLARKAWADDDFRRRFIADPKGEIAKHFGAALPDSMKITVHEEDANHVHLVIPAKPNPDAELSDEDLEKVAGGASPTTLGFAIFAIALVGGAAFGGGAAVNATYGSPQKKKNPW